MKIIAKTSEGFLLSATEQELKSLLSSFGIEKPEPSIGTTIPADDFISRVNIIKNFAASYDLRELKDRAKVLTKAIDAVELQAQTIAKI